MKTTLKFALVSAVLAVGPAAFGAEDAKSCKTIEQAIERAVKADSSKILEVVEQQVSANSGCACEVVKAAIVASEADVELVRQIVETAVVAAPGEMRIIAQCAVAVAPDAVKQVQAVVASFDPQSGEGYSAKGGLSKGGMDKTPVQPEVGGVANPLDGPLNPGGPGGYPILPPELPPLEPPVVTPPGVTTIDSSNGEEDMDSSETDSNDDNDDNIDTAVVDVLSAS
ncbi:MAG: hypothetical protein Q7Q71_03285 [Verrucomicrobiota bacterium JB023]|nr:hypothetical protein [Verrucomicrobiota bacterium JB023]